MHNYLSKSLAEKFALFEIEKQILRLPNMSLQSCQLVINSVLNYDFNFFAESIEESFSNILVQGGTSESLKGKIFTMDFEIIQKSVDRVIGMESFDQKLTLNDIVRAIETDMTSIDGHPEGTVSKFKIFKLTYAI